MRLAAVLSLLMAPVFPTGAHAAHHVIEIRNMAFGAAPAHLKVGDTIEWWNRDIFRHTATARAGSFDLDIPPGGRAQTILRRAETLTVYCRFHPTMTMRLPVTKP